MPTDVFLFLPPCEGDDYSEAHPYGPSDHHFNDHLGIDIASVLKERYPALAVVSGMARLIPDPVVPGSADPPTGTLVLLPSPSEFRNLRSVVGGSPVVFIYHNLEIDDISTDLNNRIITNREEFAEAAEEEEPSTVDELRGAFLSGSIAVSVSGGNELALAGIRADDRDCCRLGFQIAFIPSGLRLGEAESWNLLQTLITNPNTHRLDPLSFYADVLRSSSSDIRIAAAHADHPLFTLTTRRILVELRDEYDMPFQGVARFYTFTEGNRGTVVVETVSPGDEPPDDAISIPVDYPNYVFTDLPSGSSASARPSKNLTPPAHWAMQMIFMADVDDAENWFGSYSSIHCYTENNTVTHLIDGLATFREMVDAMRTITSEDHYMWLAAWWLSDDFELVPDDSNSTFAELIRSIDQTGAKIRALLWDHLGRQNSVERDHINDLPGDSHAILDNETLQPFGSHHQKLMIINGAGSDGPVGFCGGIDINPDRLDDQDHCAPSPYHDVHAKVLGPAVLDLGRTFVGRWNIHPDRPMGEELSPPSTLYDRGTQYAQVTWTYPRIAGNSHAMPHEDSTLQAVLRAIRRAKRFIYFEDQYAHPYSRDYSLSFDPSQDDLGILTELVDALDRIEFLIMVIPNHSDCPQNRKRRCNFIRTLRDAASQPDQVNVFYLVRSCTRAAPTSGSNTSTFDLNFTDIETYLASRAPVWPCRASGSPTYPNEIYVHSKLWIIDDVYAKIGSANCNRRSLTHDSEVDLHIIDGALLNGGRAFARRLRMDLWAEHLNMRGEVQRAKLQDPIYALWFWLNPPRGARIRQYHEAEQHVFLAPQELWDTLIDPDGRTY